MKIFWAWQSDTPGNIGRFFVRDTLNAAITQLKSDAEIVEPTERETREAMELDHDRKGVPGSPDLARTIMEKIEAAAVFIADVTPVGVVTVNDQEPQKKLINHNVAIELGHSLRTRTDRSLLMVMNTHYGNRADLPFDVAHKGGPIMFYLAPDADKKTIAAASAKLKPQLVEAIKLCIADEVNTKKDQQPFDAAKPGVGPAVFFSRDEVLASAGDAGEQDFRFPYERVAYMRIYPVSGNVAVGRAKIAKVFNEKKPCVMSMLVGGVTLRNTYGTIIFDFDGNTSITALTQGFKTGELWGVTGQLFKSYPINSSITGKPEAGTILPMVTFEKVFTRVLRNYVQVEAALGLAPPYTVVVGVVGLKDVYLTVPMGGDFGNGQFLGPIHDEGLQQTHTLKAVDEKSVALLLREFFNALYDLTDNVRAEVWTDQLIAAHDLPPR